MRKACPAMISMLLRNRWRTSHQQQRGYAHSHFQRWHGLHSIHPHLNHRPGIMDLPQSLFRVDFLHLLLTIPSASPGHWKDQSQAAPAALDRCRPSPVFVYAANFRPTLSTWCRWAYLSFWLWTAVIRYASLFNAISVQTTCLSGERVTGARLLQKDPSTGLTEGDNSFLLSMYFE